MKKILALILALAMVLSLAACGGSGAAEVQSSANPADDIADEMKKSYPNINGPDYSSEVGLLHLVLESEHQVEEMLEV